MSDELVNQLYMALQAISGCPKGCQCCKEHRDQMNAALAEFLNRWREQAD